MSFTPILNSLLNLRICEAFAKFNLVLRSHFGLSSSHFSLILMFREKSLIPFLRFSNRLKIICWKHLIFQVLFSFPECIMESSNRLIVRNRSFLSCEQNPKLSTNLPNHFHHLLYKRTSKRYFYSSIFLIGNYWKLIVSKHC